MVSEESKKLIATNKNKCLKRQKYFFHYDTKILFVLKFDVFDNYKYFMNDEKRFIYSLIYNNITLYYQKKSIKIKHFRKFHDNDNRRFYFNVHINVRYLKN